MNRLELYRQLKTADEGNKAKEEEKKEGENADQKSDGPPAPDQQQQAPPAAPPAMPMPAAPPMNPIDAMGQAIQSTTQGMNMIIDSFYAMQGGMPPAPGQPNGMPAAPPNPSVGQPTPPPAAPQGAMAASAPPPAPSQQPQQKTANEMYGCYTPSGTRGGDYYSFLRGRINENKAWVAGQDTTRQQQPTV